MWENVNGQRRAQRFAAMSAVLILVSLVVMWPVGGTAADWLNSTWAPSDEAERYQTVATQDDVTFDMDGDAFRDASDEKTYYIWENASGDTHYSNVTGLPSVMTTTDTATSGVTITGNRSWTVLPYYRLYFDYTALEAYQDNVVQIRLHITGLDAGQDKSRSVDFSAGGISLYSNSWTGSDTTDELDVNITIDTNDLREAIINENEQSYFKLIIKGVDSSGVSLSGSTMYTYASSNLVSRDDPLMLFGALTIAATFLGIMAVQPHNSLPFSKKGTKKGGF